MGTQGPHWLNWRCRYPDCAKNIRIRTRAEEKLTCPHCHRAQDGPAAIFRRLFELETPGDPPKEAIKATPIKATKVKVNGRPEVVKVSVAATEPAPQQTTPPPPPKPKVSALDRVLFRL